MSVVTPPRVGIIQLDPPRRIRTAGGHITSTWQPFRSFDNEEQRAAWERAQREEKKAETRAQITPRKPEPKGPGRILTPPQVGAIRPDPNLCEKAKDAPPISAVCSPAWLSLGPESFPLFNDDDVIRATHIGGSTVTKKFAAIKGSLNAYSAIAVNPLAVEKPKRIRVAVRFETTHWKRLSYLMRDAPPLLILVGASGGLYGVFSCADWSQKQLTGFATKAVQLCGELVESVPMPGRTTAALDGRVFSFLKGVGFVKDCGQYRPRNYVMFYRESNKSELPAVPPKGRRA